MGGRGGDEPGVGAASNDRPRFIIPLNFESGREECRAKTIESVLESHGLCFIVGRIDRPNRVLETAEIRVNETQIDTVCWGQVVGAQRLSGRSRLRLRAKPASPRIWIRARPFESRFHMSPIWSRRISLLSETPRDCDLRVRALERSHNRASTPIHTLSKFTSESHSVAGRRARLSGALRGQRFQKNSRCPFLGTRHAFCGGVPFETHKGVERERERGCPSSDVYVYVFRRWTQVREISAALLEKVPAPFWRSSPCCGESDTQAQTFSETSDPTLEAVKGVFAMNELAARQPAICIFVAIWTSLVWENGPLSLSLCALVLLESRETCIVPRRRECVASVDSRKRETASVRLSLDDDDDDDGVPPFFRTRQARELEVLDGSTVLLEVWPFANARNIESRTQDGACAASQRRHRFDEFRLEMLKRGRDGVSRQ